MPRYLIHVGPHKTGTTYLQLRFDAARERLRHHGVAYPIAWSSADTEPSHRKLVVALREGRTDQLRSEFDRIERDDPEYVLISAEGLNHLQEPALALLKTLTRGQPVTVIFYCRRWSDLLPSLWQEKIKHGYDETFPEFFSLNLNDPSASPIMNFALRLEIYSKLFGRDNLRLVSYSDLCDDGIDLAGHFFDALIPQHRPLIDDLPDLPIARPNQSLPPREVELIRALNAVSIRHGTMPPDSTLRSWYMANAGRFDLSRLFTAMQESAAALRFSDASSATQPLQEKLSATYSDLLVQPSRRRDLFAPQQAEIPFYLQRYLTAHSVQQTLEDIHAAFWQAFHPAESPTAAP
jgi:hypothetical protein